MVWRHAVLESRNFGIATQLSERAEARRRATRHARRRTDRARWEARRRAARWCTHRRNGHASATASGCCSARAGRHCSGCARFRGWRIDTQANHGVATQDDKAERALLLLRYRQRLVIVLVRVRASSSALFGLLALVGLGLLFGLYLAELLGWLVGTHCWKAQCSCACQTQGAGR